MSNRRRQALEIADKDNGSGAKGANAFTVQQRAFEDPEVLAKSFLGVKRCDGPFPTKKKMALMAYAEPALAQQSTGRGTACPSGPCTVSTAPPEPFQQTIAIGRRFAGSASKTKTCTEDRVHPRRQPATAAAHLLMRWRFNHKWSATPENRHSDRTRNRLSACPCDGRRV